jgi:hypothetical protein
LGVSFAVAVRLRRNEGPTLPHRRHPRPLQETRTLVPQRVPRTARSALQGLDHGVFSVLAGARMFGGQFRRCSSSEKKRGTDLEVDATPPSPSAAAGNSNTCPSKGAPYSTLSTTRTGSSSTAVRKSELACSRSWRVHACLGVSFAVAVRLRRNEGPTAGNSNTCPSKGAPYSTLSTTRTGSSSTAKNYARSTLNASTSRSVPRFFSDELQRRN